MVEAHYNHRVKQFSDEQLAIKEKVMRPLYEAVLPFANIGSGSTVAVIGSSTGSLPLFVASSAREVIGFDLSTHSLRFARRRTRLLGVRNITYRRADAERLPLEDRSVDVVLSDCVINLTPNKQAVFNEIYRVLRSPGVFVLADPVRQKPLEPVPRDLLASCIAGTVATEDYTHMLAAAGFVKVNVADITELAKRVFASHTATFDQYGLSYVIIQAVKGAGLETVADGIWDLTIGSKN